MRVKNPLIVALILTSNLLFSASWIQTTDSDFSNGETSNSEVSGTGSDASVQLKTQSSSQAGCTYRVDSRSSFNLDAATKQYSVRFTAQTTQAISKIYLCGSITGALAQYRVGIQTNTAGPNIPSGTWIDFATLDLTSGLTTGWQTIVLTGSHTITAGSYYHLVIIKSGGTTDGSNNFGMYYSSPQTGTTSVSETKDPVLSVLESTDGGASWTDRSVQPMYMVEGTSSEGAVYYSSDTGSQIYSNRYYGEKMVISGADTIVRRVAFYVKGSTVAPPPDDHLYVTLQNVTDSTDVETIKLVDKNDITGSYEWYSADFSQPRVLSVGKTYRIFLKSPYASASRYYAAYRAQGFFPQLATADNNTYGGTSYVYSENTGSGWTEPVSNYDILYKLFSATYNITGTFTSSVFDAGYTAAFNNLSWTPQVQVSGASANFQIASSNSELGPWTFTGPDGSANTYYTNAGGTVINGMHSGKRYLRYKVFMSTASSSSTPVVTSVTVAYTSRPLPGTGMQALAFPVPFNPAAGNMTINYVLTKDSKVTLKLYTALGDLVRTFNLAAGTEGGKGSADGYNNTIMWDGRNGSSMGVASGAYMIQITAEPLDGSASTTEVRKILVIR